MPSRIIPFIGIFIFVALYIYSASLYPGGSQSDKTTLGYDVFHNYWCDLFNKKALNGDYNPAWPWAIIANDILAITMAYFFYFIPKKLECGVLFSRLSPWCGVISMGFAGLLFTTYHDIVSVLSGIFGVVALAGVFYGLWQARLKWLIVFGLGCFALILMNNVIYFSRFGLYFLPIIQKITLVYILIWVWCVWNTRNNRKQRAN